MSHRQPAARRAPAGRPVAGGRRLRAATVAGLLALALAVGACGGKVIDHRKAEEFINQDLTAAGVEVEAVECPTGIEVDAGVDFECEVSADGGERAVVQLRIVDDEGRVKPIKIESADEGS